MSAGEGTDKNEADRLMEQSEATVATVRLIQKVEPCLSALRIHPLGVDCVRKMASGSILHVVCLH